MVSPWSPHFPERNPHGEIWWHLHLHHQKARLTTFQLVVRGIHPIQDAIEDPYQALRHAAPLFFPWKLVFVTQNNATGMKASKIPFQ